LDLYEAHDTELASASKQQNFSGNIRRRSTIMSSGRRKSKAESMKPATEKEVVALSNLLLIGEKSSNGDPQMDKPVSHEVRKRFMASAEDVSGAKRSASVLDSKNIAVKGYKLGPEDLLSISAEERLEILNRVKEGKMSVDDAVSEVVEHKKRQNCVIC